MKMLLVIAGASVLSWAAVGAGDVSAATCLSDSNFRTEVGSLAVARFLPTVAAAQSLEQGRVYDVLHRQFAAQKAEPLPTFTRPCTPSAKFADAVKRAAIIRASLRRVAVLIAAFPVNRAASQAQWHEVLTAAVTGAAAQLRLATDIGSPRITLSQLATQVASLRPQLKG